jgi:hypothetical protein
MYFKICFQVAHLGPDLRWRVGSPRLDLWSDLDRWVLYTNVLSVKNKERWGKRIRNADSDLDHVFFNFVQSPWIFLSVSLVRNPNLSAREKNLLNALKKLVRWSIQKSGSRPGPFLESGSRGPVQFRASNIQFRICLVSSASKIEGIVEA